jgi:hypothetical protein
MLIEAGSGRRCGGGGRGRSRSSRGDRCDDDRHCDPMAMMVMVDVMMSIMIGRNNSRAPWQVREDRVCLKELRAIRPTIKDREFPTCVARRIREFKGLGYTQASVFLLRI